MAGDKVTETVWQWCMHEAAGGGHCTRRAGHPNTEDARSHNWCYCDAVQCETLALVGVSDPRPKSRANVTDDKLVQVIVDAPVERTTLGRIHTHTAPNPTPEPDLDEITAQLSADGRWVLNDQDRRLIEDTLDAREALLAEHAIPPVGVPAVYLPDDGHWKAGGTVTVLLHAPPTAERARWRPYSERAQWRDMLRNLDFERARSEVVDRPPRCPVCEDYPWWSVALDRWVLCEDHPAEHADAVGDQS